MGASSSLAGASEGVASGAAAWAVIMKKTEAQHNELQTCPDQIDPPQMQTQNAMEAGFTHSSSFTKFGSSMFIHVDAVPVLIVLCGSAGRFSPRSLGRERGGSCYAQIRMGYNGLGFCRFKYVDWGTINFYKMVGMSMCEQCSFNLRS